MKRFIAFFLVVILLGCMSVAFAAESIKIKITPVDYQTNKAVSKTYVENELFRLKVDVTIPRFIDLRNMQLFLEIDGVEIKESNVAMMSGTYYINGIVKDQPAAICIKFKDMAFDTATTAEELYYAMQKDRTVSATHYFYSTTVNNTSNWDTNSIYIPKTGNASMLIPAMLCTVGGVVAWRKKN